ncbi:MAG: hypothetical protein ACXW32_13140 [Limisphaerales bacterium]
MKFLGLMLAVGVVLMAWGADVQKGGFGAARGDEEKKSERKTEGKSETGETTAKRVTYPFYGTLDSVDSSEKTVTLRGKKKNRVIMVTSETRIQKDGLSLKEAAPGERVSGLVRKNAEGKEEAVSIRFGAKASGK